MPTVRPRVLVASRRSIEAQVWCAGTYEFEDLVSKVAGAEVLVVESIEPRPSPLEQRVLRRLERSTGLSVKRGPRQRRVAVDGDYDLLLVRVGTPEKLDFLRKIDGWRDRARVAVCWITELWANLLRHGRWLDPLREFDHVFVEQAFTVAPLSRAIGRPCSLLAPGVDALKFCPHPNPPERSIDVYAMGRRGPATHAAMLGHARATPGFTYLYDTAGLGKFVNGAAEHRELMINLIQRSRYFIANRAKVDVPEQNGNQQEYGPRFFEGAGAGAILIGEPPRCEAFERAFDWPDAMFCLPFNSTEIVDIVKELDRQPERMAKARQAGILNTLRRNDWIHRWREILRTLDFPVTEGVRRRIDVLEGVAATLRESGVKREPSASPTIQPCPVEDG